MRISYKELNDDALIYRVVENYVTTNEYEVELSDCSIRINSKHLVVNLLIWKVLFNLNIPLHSKYLYTSTIFSEDKVSEIFSLIIDTILIENSQTRIENAKEEFWKYYNNLYNFTTIYLAEFQSSISIHDFSTVLKYPEVIEMSKLDYNMTLGTEYIENQLANRKESLIALLSDRKKYKNNPFISFLEPDLLNKNQLVPMFIAGGIKTDINDIVVKKAIKSNFTEGLSDIQEYGIEHLSAKKSIYYNKMAIRNSQYFSRKQQLAILPVENIYQHDCGSTLTVSFDIKDFNKNNLFGKNIVLGGNLITLNKNNIGDYLNTTVYMKSPITCRYRDGVCHTCGGLLTRYLPAKLHIGMQCSSDFTSRVTQLILSNKHFGNTKSLEYKLPDEASEFLSSRSAGVYIKKEIFRSMGEDFKLGVFMKDIKGSLNDINLISNDAVVSEERFSEISGVIFKSESRGEYILPLISGRHIPFFTIEMLHYIKSMDSLVDMSDNMVWIPMNKLPWNTPIFRAPVINDSMLEFVKEAQDFVQSTITSYSSASECLKDFNKLIYRKVNINILCLEVLLKAYLITSERDYRIPEVTDVNNVIFQKNSKLISNRTISGEFAFQNLLKYVLTPTTYLHPKSPGVMDRYFDL